jgi:hypothetical protein
MLKRLQMTLATPAGFEPATFSLEGRFNTENNCARHRQGSVSGLISPGYAVHTVSLNSSG